MGGSVFGDPPYGVLIWLYMFTFLASINTGSAFCKPWAVFVVICFLNIFLIAKDGRHFLKHLLVT